MEEKRVLKINPVLFSLANNTTRKKKGTDGGQPIKMKQNANKREDSLKKKSILRMIREHQAEQYNSLFDKKQNTIKDEGNDTFNKEFEEATEYLNHLIKQKAKKENPTPNKTLKNYNAINEPVNYISDLMSPTYTPTSLSLSPSIPPPPLFHMPPAQNYNSELQPKYGCMKNGTLPTFRTFMQNTTQKKYPPLSNSHAIESGQPNISIHPSQSHVRTEINNLAPDQIINQKIQQSIEHLENNAGLIDTMKQQHLNQTKANELAAFTRSMRPKIYKQRKIKRRTYKIGRSKGSRKISVLISNKTIRHNVSEKAQNIKQVSMSDVKKYLIKRGFIKIGTTAPNDVLRKMYESSILMCGEVQNHNADNLLFNFFNEDKK